MEVSTIDIHMFIKKGKRIKSILPWILIMHQDKQ